jgi:para-nitrobenzyl esterase
VLKPALGSRVLPVLVSVGVTAAGLAEGLSPATQQAATSARVAVAEGVLEGSIEPDGIRSFKGVPFASPPVGNLRWRAPMPARAWSGTRRATEFGARCLQSDQLKFRSSHASEDCLFLNVWTPAKGAEDRLPVLVYFHGGGFGLGDGSEPRHDGAALARKGIVTVTANYRLRLFGFLAHPALTAESSHGGSGNYGLLDQSAALRWVWENIAAFGGDPARVTIAGNSSGSASVSGLMVSPRSRDLIAGAIGSAGAMIRSDGPPWSPTPLADAEQVGVKFAEAVGARSLSDLRALTVEELDRRYSPPPYFQFFPVLDGDFLTKPPAEYFASGEQAKVPLLVGWTSHELGPQILGKDPPNPANFAASVQRLYRERSQEILSAYAATTSDEIVDAATSLTGDRSWVFGTWKWAELHGQTGNSAVYRYLFVHRPSACGGATPLGTTRPPRHGDDIDYAMGNGRVAACGTWRPDDEAVSQLLQEAYVRFVKTGNPNGAGLPPWTATNDRSGAQVLYFDINPRVEPDRHRQRYVLLDSIYSPR